MNIKMWSAFATLHLVAPRPSYALRVALVALVLAALSVPLSAPHAARAGGNFVVNSSADTIATDNYLTLREAIQVANGDYVGPFTAAEAAQLGGCVFEDYYIIGGCGGFVFDNITFDPSVTQINLTSFLPILTDAGTWINGNAGAPRIDASGASVSTFLISGNDITISNLSIYNSDSSSISADIFVTSGKDTRIAYNYLGTMPGATNCTPSGVTRNSAYGVYIAPNSSGSSGANNGVAYIYGNTIGCHSSHGIFVDGADYVYIGVRPDSPDPAGNYIGINSDGYNLGNGSDGVYLQASGSDGVRWNVVKNNSLSRNQGNGIRLAGTGYNNDDSTSNNCIQSNSIYWNGQSGIRLTAGAYTNSIGGTSDFNVIGWNGEDGITVQNSNNNLIQGNGIGIGSGAAPPFNRGNSKAGVYLENADGNTVAGNVISANGWAGVWAYNSTGNIIKGNRIGTNDFGTSAMPNGHDGIALTDNSHDNTIGGATLADRNTISGNTLCGIRLRDGAYNNTIDFNLIGLNAAGTGAIPNGLAGVCVFSGSNNNAIGTSFAGVYQYISGNTREGIYIENSSNNLIGQSNHIGVATDNVTACGNGLQGVMLNGPTNSTVQPDLVAYNGGAGIAVIGSTATGNDVGPINIWGNGGLPIDLGNDGHTPNGSHTPPGPNNWLNYPVITGDSGSTLNGTACANCTVFIYRAIGNPATPGGGGRYLRSVVANGLGDWSATLPVGTGRNDVTVQARDSARNTSEMSPRPQLYLPLVLK